MSENHESEITLLRKAIARLSDRIGILHGGRLVAEGTVDELTARVGGKDLEEVFMTLTGRRLEEADTEGEEAGSK